LTFLASHYGIGLGTKPPINNAWWKQKAVALARTSVGKRSFRYV
jgi:hypothetical protein